MAKTATADNVVDMPKAVDTGKIVEALEKRDRAYEPLKDAKSDYDALCKDQNEALGVNKKAMNMLSSLNRMSPEKFQDTIRTLEPGLSALIATHNHELASRMDRRVTLAEGKVVEVVA